MHLVKVDVIGLQSPQALLACSTDVAGRETSVIRPFGHRAERLRGEHHLLPPAATEREPAPDDLLRAAGAETAAVTVRSVEEVDPELEGAIHDGVRVGFLGLQAEVHRAE